MSLRNLFKKEEVIKHTEYSSIVLTATIYEHYEYSMCLKGYVRNAVARNPNI
jgi:hypothetical protein